MEKKILIENGEFVINIIPYFQSIYNDVLSVEDCVIYAKNVLKNNTDLPANWRIHLCVKNLQGELIPAKVVLSPLEFLQTEGIKDFDFVVNKWFDDFIRKNQKHLDKLEAFANKLHRIKTLFNANVDLVDDILEISKTDLLENLVK